MTSRASARAARFLLPALALLAGPPSLLAQNAAGAHPAEPPRTAAVLREGAVQLDGVLDEAFWAAAQPATGFRQSDPAEGQPATQRTEVRFAYDDAAIYVGARMHDSLGAGGVRTRLARRDQAVEGDYLRITFDTFHDHAGRTEFRINPSGARGDAGQASPHADPSWDPVWEAATRVDSAGWTAELRIPLSQLRFPRDSVLTWGVQITRFVERLNETSSWSFWGKQENGGPQRYGHLEGLKLRGRSGGWELMPYALARGSYVTPLQAGSPFEDASEHNVRVGLDVKALLGSSFTLSATVNPDFGQVEVDPAVVNLSASETYFNEKRPFFVEGSGLFGFGSFSCRFCSNVDGMSLFYSRRIGRRPQGWLPFDTEYEHTPEAADILAAAKVTGRTAGGWEVGLLDAVTASERARAVSLDGAPVEREVEPFTNYLLGRVRRTMRGGNATVGLMATSVVRAFGYDSLRQQLPAHSEAVGVDWNLAWRNRTYTFMGNFAVSQVSGDSAAIELLQGSSARYFRRPDREAHGNGVFTNAYDPGLTSLRGFGGYARVGKDAGALRAEAMVNYRSPGFEINDIGFLTRTDYVWMNTNVWRHWTNPTRWYRAAGGAVGGQQQYNWDGDLTDRQLHASAFVDFLNYWGTGAFFMYRPETFDDRLTRGGAVVRKAANYYVQGSLYSDQRRPVVISSNPSFAWNDEGGESWAVDLNLRMKPASNVQLSLQPSFYRGNYHAQYVTSFDDPSATHFHGDRVVFSSLTQRTLSMNTRLNVTFSPELSLELFAQPYVSTGDYSAFKEFDAPRGLAKTRFGADQISAVPDRLGRDSVYVLDADRDPSTAALTFRNPDFNFRSLRGNAVLRWEYRPGSTLFFVWQQQRSRRHPFGDFDMQRDAQAVFRERPDNVFVIKASYWLGR